MDAGAARLLLQRTLLCLVHSVCPQIQKYLLCVMFVQGILIVIYSTKMKKLRNDEVKELCQGHTSRKS